MPRSLLAAHRSSDQLTLKRCTPGRADQAAVEKISGVELHAGLSGLNFQHAPGGLVFEPRREDQRRVAFGAVEHPVVVVAARQHKLRMVVADSLCDAPGRAKVERVPATSATPMGISCLSTGV